jgi:hypothetical protein
MLKDGGGAAVGLGDPGQPGAGHGLHGEVQAAVSGAQAPGGQRPARRIAGKHQYDIP